MNAAIWLHQLCILSYVPENKTYSQKSQPHHLHPVFQRTDIIIMQTVLKKI